MRLPNGDQAIVPQQKIVEYLLSPTHRDGRSKAVYFGKFGFSAQAWEVFAEALRRHVADNEVIEIEPTPFGISYIIEGALSAPDGRSPKVRVVWFIETGQTIPRLVTAYPSKGSHL